MTLKPIGIDDEGQLPVRARAALAGNLTDSDSPEGAALSATIAELVDAEVETGGIIRTAIDATAGGNTIVFDGDSITERPVGGALNGPSIANYAAIHSKGRARLAGVTAVSGTTIQQMVDRFDATIVPLAPRYVHLIAGTNDANDATATPVGTYIQRVAAYHEKCKAIGAKLILGTIPPNTVSTARHGRTVAYNKALRDFASTRGIPMIDYYAALVDPATGNIKAAYNADGTHPTNLGNRDLGKIAGEALATILPRVDVQLPQSNADPNNLLPNGIFLTTTGTVGPPDNIRPTSWSMSPSGRNAGIVGSLVTGDPSIIGNWWKLDATAAAAGELDFYNVAAGAVIPGHVYEFVGRVKAEGLRNADSGAGATYMLTARFNNQNGIAGYDHRILSNVSYDVEGVFSRRFVAPNDAASLQVQSSLGVTTATDANVWLAQLGLYDLTAMGLA